MIARYYRMVAARGREAELMQALTDLRRQVQSLEGSLNVDLFHDTKDPSIFIFIERWESIDAHKAAGSKLPKESLGRVMAVLAQPPEGSYLDVIKE